MALIVSIVAVVIAGAAFLLGEARERRREQRDQERDERDTKRFAMDERREAREVAATPRAILEIPGTPPFEPDGSLMTLIRVSVHNVGDLPARNTRVRLTIGGNEHRVFGEDERVTLAGGGKGHQFAVRVPTSEIESNAGAWLTFNDGEPVITATCDDGVTATWPPTGTA